MLICVIIPCKDLEWMYMPNFDGTGPLKRGRLIGRGRGPCRKNAGGNRQQEPDAPVQKNPAKDNVQAET
ncbi:MAG: DUF5320 family protein [Methanoregula sp.]|uniref:DUF5320 family protein n=1 Tax=Methanoregula sp. TaxID=2052170 RepID=UPI003FD7A5DD